MLSVKEWNGRIWVARLASSVFNNELWFNSWTLACFSIRVKANDCRVKGCNNYNSHVSESVDLCNERLIQRIGLKKWAGSACLRIRCARYRSAACAATLECRSRPVYVWVHFRHLWSEWSDKCQKSAPHCTNTYAFCVCWIKAGKLMIWELSEI